MTISAAEAPALKPEVGRTVRFEAPDEDGIGRIVIDRPDDSVNAINSELLEDLAAAVRTARSYEKLKGLVVASAKNGQFVAGADLKMVGRADDPGQLSNVSRRFQAVLDELAWLPCTTVAAINGPALGGGLELALACDYRVGIESPSLTTGQPEVNLGLVPAGGGTQRLPRLIGLPAALDLILSGRRLNARRAKRIGLLDEVVHPTVLAQAAQAWAGKPKRPLDRPLHLDFSTRAAIDIAELTPPGRRIMYQQARASVIARTKGHYPAPLRALEAIEIGLEQGMAAGLAAEAQAFADLAGSETAKHLIWLFMATQRQKRLPGTLGPPRVESRTSSPQEGSRETSVTRVGVVGAGFMGAAIAEVSAAAGVPVRLKDVKPEAVAKGLSSIRKMLDGGVKRRRFDAREAQHIMQRVSGTTDYSGFHNAELVIEAVFEDLKIKQQVIQELEANIKPTAAIASNTSAIPIKEIARQAKNPERIVGMHFFSPAERMPLLEVIRPDGAADWALQAAVALGTRMGKTVIVVADSPGFYTSRVLGVMMNEAAVMLTEGARIEEIDNTMTAFGFPVGPFVLYDEVGLEVAQHAGESVERAFADRVPRTNVVPQLIAAGHTGRKANAGFYLWHTSSLPRPIRDLVKRPTHTVNPSIYRLAGAKEQRTFGEQYIQDRLALLFVNEAIRCLEEGVLQSSVDGDLGAVLGLGFPPFRGGPFHYADNFGLSKLADKLSSLAQAHGSRYVPTALLVQRAREGRTFFEE